MTDHLRVAVLGAGGRMGRLVVAEIEAAPDLALVASVGRSSGLRPIAPGCFGDAQVIIDFSLPEALVAALPFVKAPLVSGTTGLSPAAVDALAELSADVAVLHATNFSTGVNLLLHLVREAARALPDYDVEIVETHHRLKQDSPSGTALSLGAAAAEGHQSSLADVARHGREGRVGARPAGEIGFHAVRGGDVVGDHDVWLMGPGERLRLTHLASSRTTFAVGAVRAARWLAVRGPGRYTMNQVLGL